MKFTMLAVVVALAAAAAPKIELDLSEMSEQALFRLSKPIMREHDLRKKFGKPDSSQGSRQDYTEKCAADPTGKTNAQNCPLPSARAFDYHDGEKVTVTSR